MKAHKSNCRSLCAPQLQVKFVCHFDKTYQKLRFLLLAEFHFQSWRGGKKKYSARNRVSTRSQILLYEYPNPIPHNDKLCCGHDNKMNLFV